jgi:hypothetical protein
MSQRYFLADLRTGRQILDLNPITGPWERFLNQPESVSCTLDMRDKDTIALRPRIAAAAGRAVLAVAEGDVVLGAGPIWTHRYNSDDKTLQLNAKGLWSYWDHRYLLPLAAADIDVRDFTIPDPSAAGKTMPNPALATYLNGMELGTIAKRWVQQAREWTGGDVPVVFEDDRLAPSDEDHERNIEGASFKKVGEVLRQLTEVEGGPDIRFRPRMTADKLGIEWVLETGTETKPMLAGSTVHEWSLGLNSQVSGLNVSVDASALAGTAWATGGRSGDEVLVARSVDPYLVERGFPLLESLDSSHSSVSKQATLDGYAAEGTTLGRGPVEEWSFNVEADTNPKLSSYWEGDWCDISIPAYNPERGDGDPYLFEKYTSRRRITGFSGNVKGDIVNITTAATRGT